MRSIIVKNKTVNKKMKVLINKKTKHIHSTDWSFPWIDYCNQIGIEYDVADLFQENTIEILEKYDCLLWHFGQYNFIDMLEARSILYVAKQMGLKVFPDFNESWHFDDKVAEMYLLQSIGAPIPKSNVFYDWDTFETWLGKKENKFPIVGKLRTGSGSHNVKLLKTNHALTRYAKRMLGKGFNPAPNLLYKTSSNIRSSHDWATFIAKAKRIPEFIRVLFEANKFPKERGYIYLQEFIPNDGYDMKVVVVGDKLSGLIRPIRSHDFRASGGGEVFFDKKYFTNDIIKSAFKITDSLGMQCIGYDYVINNKSQQPIIVEMSYGFSHNAILKSGGYFDRDYIWHDEPLNVPLEIIKKL
ncbi:hypothetical protein AGMMS49574_28740 [Bacteroidia bacterium]|nr:hypothetical protein AGMMS49574_28740 [Bacteroidia bacterium]